MSDNRPVRKARAVGIIHVALEFGDIDEALAFYGGFLDFEISRRSESAAFIYFGEQFINFSRGRRQEPDDNRRFGIAVDDKELVRRTLAEMAWLPRDAGGGRGGQGAHADTVGSFPFS